MTSAAREQSSAAEPAVGADPVGRTLPVAHRSGRDRLVLTGVRAWGRHGVLRHEREQGQHFVVDVALGLDLAPAATSDDLSRTVDYGTLAADVVADVQGEPLDLIEALAERVARTCLTRPEVAEVEVTVHKPEAPIGVTFTDVAVTLTRSRP